MSARERSWPVPVALVALSAIPLTARTLRLSQVAGGPAVIPADHRFASLPIALVVHILGATIHALAGILQFVPKVSPPAPGLAPSGRPGGDRDRAARVDLGGLDDAVLRGVARHRRPAPRAPPGLRVRDDRLPRVRHDPRRIRRHHGHRPGRRPSATSRGTRRPARHRRAPRRSTRSVGSGHRRCWASCC